MKRFLAGLVAGAVAVCAGYALASRNSAGTMSAVNGPYVPSTVINSSQINSRYSDIEAEITNSLDRSGRGGMLAALRGIDGTVAAPALSFTSETGSGLYRIGTSDVGFAISGTKKLELTTTGLVVTSGNGAALKTLSGAAGTATDIAIGRTATEARFAVSAGANNYASGTAAGDIVLGTLGTKMWFDTNSGSGTPSMTIAAANGGVSTPNGLTIGSAGTAISASIRGTVSWTPGTINSLACATNTITVTGATAGTECLATSPSGTGAFVLSCYVTSNTCNLSLCNPTSANSGSNSGTYVCRVFNP